MLIECHEDEQAVKYDLDEINGGCACNAPPTHPFANRRQRQDDKIGRKDTDAQIDY